MNLIKHLLACGMVDIFSLRLRQIMLFSEHSRTIANALKAQFVLAFKDVAFTAVRRKSPQDSSTTPIRAQTIEGIER
ncbi:MAG: hypothetical protein ACKOVA_11790 [Novosphingobium sp.]